MNRPGQITILFRQIPRKQFTNPGVGFHEQPSEKTSDNKKNRESIIMNYGSKISVNTRLWVIRAVCITIPGLAYGFGLYLLPMVIPEMAKDLQLNYTMIGIITGGGQMVTFLAIPLAGYLTGRIGGLRFLVWIQLIGGFLLFGLYFVHGFFDCFIFFV